MARKWTDEQRKAFGEQMKARRDAKAAAKEESDREKAVIAARDKEIRALENEFLLDKPVQTTAPAAPEVKETITQESNTDQILKRAIEAIEMLTKLQLNGSQQAQVNQAGVQLNGNGKLTGTINRFDINPSSYPDPSERLAKEPRLKRFGFEENYKLMFTMTTVEYTTIDNIRMREPKFQLDLVHLIHDEDTGDLTGGAYTEYRNILHEDPETALIVARNNGIQVEEENEIAFLNEMRYIQMRDWLLECFYKPKSNNNSSHRQTVINGKLVDFFEVNSKNTAKIPFAELDNKL